MREPFRDGLPIRSAVQVDPDPAALPDIRRPEVPIGRTGQEKVLRDVSGLAPDGVAAGAMVIGRVGERREHLLADPERRFTVRHLLPGARERQAQSTQPREWVRHRSRGDRRQVRENATATGLDHGRVNTCADRASLKSIPWMVQHARRLGLVKMLRCKGLRGGTGCVGHNFSARSA